MILTRIFGFASPVNGVARQRRSDRRENLDRRFMNLSFQTMNAAARVLQLRVIMRLEGCVAFLLPIFDASLDRRFVDPDHIMVLVYVDIESFTNGDDEVLFIQLREALHGFVVHILRDVA